MNKDNAPTPLRMSKDYSRSFRLAGKALAFHDPVAAGAFVQQEMARREEFRAAQGTPKILFLDGKPVPPEWQLLPAAEIRKRRNV
jgi:hypothetical protein